MSIKRTLETNAQLAEAGKPSMRALDNPAMPAEPVVLLDATASNPGNDAPLAQMLPVQGQPQFWIYLTNAALLLVTLGLFMPFAKVRLARYKLESVTLLAAGSLDTFIAGESTKVDALGDAAVDWYDIDIAL